MTWLICVKCTVPFNIKNNCHCIGSVTIPLELLPQVHWGFDQPLNWAWLAWVRRNRHIISDMGV